MSTIGIIVIVILVIIWIASIVVSSINTYYEKKRIHVMEQQNEIMKQQNALLWAVVEQSKQLIAEALKEAEKVNAKTQEVKITIDGDEMFNNLKSKAREGAGNL